LETRRIKITRPTSDDARKYVAEIVKKSTVSLRGSVPDEILSVLNAIDFDKTNIPEGIFGTDAILSEKNINNLLDLIYMDLVVQYNDMFTIQDYMFQLKNTFDSVISSNITRASDIVHQAKRFKKLAECHLEFTDVIHEDLSSAVNYAPEGLKLQTNRNAGCMRLPGIEENYLYRESSDVKLNLFSSSASIIDETDPNLVYQSDMSEPYYITAVSNTLPVNNETNVNDLTETEGIIVDFTITFNSTLPVTRITLVPFSTHPVKIVGIYYSIVPGADWDSDDMKLASSIEIETDKLEFEINISRIYAREIHILINQDNYITPDTTTRLDSIISAMDYTSSIVEKSDTVYPEFFNEPSDVNIQVGEICTSFENIVKRSESIPLPNSKFYTVGICSASVSNVSYMQTGIYLSEQRSIDGNLSDVSYIGEGSIDKSDQSGINDGCTLFSILVSNNSIYLGSLDSDGKVLDGSVIAQNMVYSNGNYIENPTHPGTISTHFLPTNTLDDIEIYTNGTLITSVPSGSIVTFGTRSCTIELPSAFMSENELVQGSAVTMAYTPAAYDIYDMPYNVNSVNIIDVIGSPTFYSKDSARIKKQYIYVNPGSDNIPYAPKLESSPSEYVPVYLSGDLFMKVETNKGFSIDSSHISNNGSFYIKESEVNGPYEFLYYGVINEPAISGSLEGSTRTMSTGLQYIKGSLTVMNNGSPITGFTECDILASGDLATRFYIPSSYNPQNITTSYIPVDPDASSSYLSSNIASHTTSEQFTKTDECKLILSKYPFVDKNIVSSNTFDFANGIFYLKNKYSVVYEPIIVFINGIKATNITSYRTSSSIRPTFTKTYREDDYQFFVENGNRLIFNKDVKGSIIVYYYTFTNSFREQIEMYRSNYKRDYITPELNGYSILTNITR
jgi:hypothetical protein